MRFPQLIEVVEVEQASFGERRFANLALRAVAEIPAEPLRDWGAETLFLTVDHVVGEPSLGGVLEDVLAHTIPHLHARRKRKRELNEVVVEERHSGLD